MPFQPTIQPNRAVGILDDWEKAREDSESHFLRHRVGKEVESWLVRYSGDGELLAELINALPAHHTAQYILQFKAELGQSRETERELQTELEQSREKERELQKNRWYCFGQLSRKRKLWVIAKVLSKKLRIYKLLQPLAKIIRKILQRKQV